MRTIPDGDKQPSYPLGQPVNREPEKKPADPWHTIPGKPGHYVNDKGERCYRPPILG